MLLNMYVMNTLFKGEECLYLAEFVDNDGHYSSMGTIPFKH
jgi:hypothetical protein